LTYKKTLPYEKLLPFAKRWKKLKGAFYGEIMTNLVDLI
jgi:hypothetical protein